MSQPASPATRKAIYENMGKTIESFSPILKETIIIKEGLDIIKKDNSLNEKTNKIFDAFLSLYLYVQFMNVELASVLRACFRANLFPEKRYNLKYINSQILEGYKYLYGYGNKRRKSIWVSKVKPLLDIINEQEFENDYKNLESQIVKFGEENIANKEQRDLTFHYDLEPVKVYNMLMELSEETETQRLIRFMDLLQSISSFISKYIGRYKLNHKIETNSISKYSFSFSDLDIFQNNKSFFYSSLENSIDSYAKRLDNFINHQSIPNQIKQHFENLDEESIFYINQFIEIEKVAIQLLFLYIDLASANRAFISSEYTIEKQLSLKQINTIIYEGLNKLYGFNDKKEDTFWKKYVYPIISSSIDLSILDEFNVLTQEFNVFEKEMKAFETQRQLSVHYDKGIVQVYNMLHNLNPIKEFQRALLLLNFLPKILNFLTKCLHIIDLKQKKYHEKNMASTNKTIENILGLLENLPNTSQKEDIINTLKKIQTGEFFDDIVNRVQKNKPLS
ncbi:MAG: hypothetical protein LBS20_14465 [Prevotella sp.]|jgi:hypothetical protein|nr:hypothetical protein [Prevotella sp.]